MIIWIFTLFCAAVEVLVVWISVLISNFRMDFAAGICERVTNSESNKKLWSVQIKVKIHTI